MKDTNLIIKSLKKSLYVYLIWKEERPEPDFLHPTEADYLYWMLEQLEANPEWLNDKINRWIGYIQGAMVARGYSTLDYERKRIREISEVE